MPQLTVELANTVINTGVKNTYAEPIVLGDTTVIPVASQVFGFGAGENSDAKAKESAGGTAGAGAGVSLPLGAYVKRGEDFRFEMNPVAFVIVAVPFVVAVGKTLSRIIRALKR